MESEVTSSASGIGVKAVVVIVLSSHKTTTNAREQLDQSNHRGNSLDIPLVRVV